uniref:Uncharacterized protein n=1 Tax=Vombatus ursinus TaxID=29139 RepID=A0A4X2JXW6_VOMUR
MTDTVLDPQQGNSSKEMDGLCPQMLLLPLPLSDRGVPGPVQSPSYSDTLPPLPTNSNCLLVEATAAEGNTGSMEIFVEAVTGDLSQSAPGETPATERSSVEGKLSKGAGSSLPGGKPVEEEEEKEENGKDLLSPEEKEEKKKEEDESEAKGGSSKKVQKTRKGTRQFKGNFISPGALVGNALRFTKYVLSLG